MTGDIERLIAARALIEDPAHWCQNVNALNAAGHPCPTRGPDAVCWCAMGACWAVGAQDTLLRQHCAHSVQHLNDNGTHQDVLDLFDYTINRMLTP